MFFYSRIVVRYFGTTPCILKYILVSMCQQIGDEDNCDADKFRNKLNLE